MSNLKEILNQAAKALAECHGFDQSDWALEARLLLQCTLGVTHAWIITHASHPVSEAHFESFQQYLSRRLKGEPMAYILGHREFYGLGLKTTSATLIPRPDTETLVEAALAKIPANSVCSVLDLGTGTGAIALAIASQRPQAQVTAVDFSAEALKVAVDNGESLKLNHVKFIKSHWLSEFTQSSYEKFDVIVSNPPYIREDDIHLRQGDLRFEPISALASGVDGLDDIRIIINQAPQHLNMNAWLMLEHGYDQASDVAQLLTDAGFTQISHALDLAGIQRVTLGCWQSSS